MAYRGNVCHQKGSPRVQLIIGRVHAKYESSSSETDGQTLWPIEGLNAIKRGVLFYMTFEQFSKDLHILWLIVTPDLIRRYPTVFLRPASSQPFPFKFGL